MSLDDPSRVIMNKMDIINCDAPTQRPPYWRVQIPISWHEYESHGKTACRSDAPAHRSYNVSLQNGLFRRTTGRIFIREVLALV